VASEKTVLTLRGFGMGVRIEKGVVDLFISSAILFGCSAEIFLLFFGIVA